MPYKSLSSPRAQLDVGAEIRAAATLATPTVVAMVSSDPVRIGLVPASGSGKVCATQLGSAEAVALLGKDVALVQRGDEVWSLSDITHTARPEQVARDVRSLHGRPGGDSALVLGWDGSATQITWGKDEASTRTFALRGDVRALCLDAMETFVVVAGGAGGELRFHPGATPEPGASGRCPSPPPRRRSIASAAGASWWSCSPPDGARCAWCGGAARRSSPRWWSSRWRRWTWRSASRASSPSSPMGAPRSTTARPWSAPARVASSHRPAR
ncbi:MAG: hypothetical protein WKG00_17205 [Polyangiaceae bacterium]